MPKHSGPVQLGSFSLEYERYQIYTYKTFKIIILVENRFAGIDVREEFQHTCRSEECTNAINDITIEPLTPPLITHGNLARDNEYIIKFRIKVKNISPNPAATPVRSVPFHWTLECFPFDLIYGASPGYRESIIEEIPVDRWIEKEVSAYLFTSPDLQMCEFSVYLDRRRSILETNPSNNSSTIRFNNW
jgi:hypothetical protein